MHVNEPNVEKLLTWEATVQQGEPLLLEGERGTGKESLAWQIHQASKQGAFVAVHCSNDVRMLEEDIFGSVSHGFVGIYRETQGVFEQARRGTIFVDDVDALALEYQVKLLRTLLDREFVPVGDPYPRTLDSRLIFSTTKDLREQVRAGRFREDLAQRLLNHRLHLTPLHRRIDEVPRLIKQMRQTALSRELRGLFVNDDAPIFSGETLAAAQQYKWPENLRELEEEILCALVNAGAGQVIGPDHLFPRDGATRHERLIIALDVLLQRHQRQSWNCDEVISWMDQTNRKLAAKKSSRTWRCGESIPQWRRRSAPTPLANPLEPVASLLVRRDRLNKTPRWPALLANELANRLFPPWWVVGSEPASWACVRC